MDQLLACSCLLSAWRLVAASRSEAARLKSTRLLHLGLLLVTSWVALPRRALRSASCRQTLLWMILPQPFGNDLCRRSDRSQREVYRFRFYSKARERLFDRVRVLWECHCQDSAPKFKQLAADALTGLVIVSLLFLESSRFSYEVRVERATGNVASSATTPFRAVAGTKLREAAESERAGCDVFN